MKIKITYSKIFILLVGFLMIVNTFYTSFSSKAKMIGLASLLIFLVINNVYLLLYLFKKGLFNKKMFKTLITATLVISLYFIGVILDGLSFEALKVLLQLILVINLFLGLTFYNWTVEKVRIIGILVCLWVNSYFIFWVLSGFQIHFKGTIENPNVFGGIVLYFLFFLIVVFKSEKRKILKLFWFISILIGILLCLTSMARSVWLAGIAIFLTYCIWDKLNRRYLFNIIFNFLIFFIIIGTYLYSNITDFYFVENINEIVRTYTGKNFLSGRQKIWNLLINAIEQKPFIGYGAGTKPSTFTSINLSAHNLYIQIAIQVGLTGLISFFYFLKSIWDVMWYGKHNFIVKLSSAFFIGMLIHQMFEVFLTQNNLAIGVIQWTILAIGYSMSIQVISNKKEIDKGDYNL